VAGENDLKSSVGMDTTAFKAGVTELNAQIKSIETGFRASAAVMGDWSNTSNGLGERTTSLSDKLTLQKQKLEILNAEYQKAVTEQGATSKAAASLANQMFSAEKAISSTESDLKKYDSQLKTVATQEKENNSSLSKLKSGFMSLADQSNKSTSSISSGFSNLKNTIMGFVSIAAVAGAVKVVADEMNDEAKTAAQMGAVLKSTGDASGMASKQLTDLADAQSKVTTYSKDTTEQAENMMLTFTGVGSKVFPQATLAAEDMATAMHTNATDAAKTLGKALNDPVLGLAKLTKQGVVFTAAQKEQIASMEKAGNVAGAQGVIIAELTREFGGSAKAAGETLPGQIQIMTNGLKESGASILSSFMPIVTSMMPMFVNAIQGISSVITAHKSEIVGAVSMVATVVKDIFGFVENHGALIKGAIVGIVGAMAAWKLVTLASMVVQGVQTGILAAQVLVSGSATAAKAVLTAATEAGTGAQIAENAAMMAGMLPIIAIVAAVALLAFGVYELIKNWSTVSAFFVELWAGIRVVFSVIGKWFSDVFGGAAAGIMAAFSIIGGFFSGIWDGIKSGFSSAVNFMISGLNGLIKGILFPFNIIIKGLDLIPGVNIPQLSLVIPNIPKFDVGTNYVPQDMLAMVHKGEMITPRAQNPYANGGGSSAGSTTNNYSSGPSQIVLINQIDGKEISRQIIPISLGIAQQSRNRGAAIGNVY
jgi:hypothetical protein